MKTNKTIAITRLTADAVNPNIKTWQDVGTATVMFLPLNNEQKQIAKAEGIMGKAYNLYAELGADIQATDRVTIDSEKYDVRGIKKYEGTQTVDHLEIIIEKIKE